MPEDVLVLRGRAPFGQHQESRPLAGLNFRILGQSDLTDLMASPILVHRGHVPFGQHQESRPLKPLTRSNTGSPLFTDFPSLCACSESSLRNLIGSGLNLWCLQSHSKPECRLTWPEVAILGADQKERGLWGRAWVSP